MHNTGMPHLSSHLIIELFSSSAALKTFNRQQHHDTLLSLVVSSFTLSGATIEFLIKWPTLLTTMLLPSDSGDDSNNPPCLLRLSPDSSDNSSGFFDTGAAFGGHSAPRGAFNKLPNPKKLTVVYRLSVVSPEDYLPRINPVVIVPLSLEEIHPRRNVSDSILAKFAVLDIEVSYRTINSSQ